MCLNHSHAGVTITATPVPINPWHIQTGFPRSVATKNVLELCCTVLLNSVLSQPGVIHLVSTSFSNLPSHQVPMINSHGRAWTLGNLIKKKTTQKYIKMQIKVSIILLRSEKSVATWGLSTCLSMIWEDRLQ